MLVNSMSIDLTNFTMPLNLNSGSVQKDLFNLTTSGYFDPPPPPGGPGAPFSPLFNQPHLELIPAVTIDWSFLKNLVLPNVATDLSNWFFSHLSETSSQDLVFSKGSISSSLRKVPSKFEKLYGRSVVEDRYFVYGAMFSSTARTQEINAMAQAGNIGALQELTDSEIKRIDFNELARIGQLDALKHIVSRGIKLQDQRASITGYDVIHTAAQHGRVDVLKYLHSLGLGLNQRADRRGLRPAHLAILNERLEVLRYFDEIGINYDITITKAERTWHTPRTYSGLTSLQLAILSGNIEMAEHIRKRGYDVNAVNEHGHAPVHTAVAKAGTERGWRDSGAARVIMSQSLTQEKMVAMISWLKDQGADLNVQDSKTQTMAHYVANIISTDLSKKEREAYYKRIIGELEPLGVDFTVTDRDGKTPKQIFDAMSDRKYRELDLNDYGDVSEDFGVDY